MVKATPHGANSSRATWGVVLPERFWSTRRGRRVSKEQALYYGYGGTGVLGLDARLANNKARRLRTVASNPAQGYDVWYDDFAKDALRGLVLPPLPEIANKVARWRRTWARTKDRERRAYTRVTSGLVGRSARLVGPMGPRDRG